MAVKAEIKSVKELLEMKLFIPDYQRPYKWTCKNISDLLSDIDTALADAQKYGADYRYRVGTIILNRTRENNSDKFGIVDGQQRIISLILLRLYLDKDSNFPLLDSGFGNKISQANIHDNFRFIADWFSLKTNEYERSVEDALGGILEVVAVEVDNEQEAFALFDSQNTRGRALDPHDLLKAYHLREMKRYPYEMRHAVTKWEAADTKEIRELFGLFLYPIRLWSKRIKSRTFTANEIDVYKGISEDSPYTYAKKAGKSMPYFQIGEPFISGNDFFRMVEHYLELLNDVKTEFESNEKLAAIKKILNDKEKNSAGFRYVTNLFYCAVLCYYDKFRNFDEQAVKKLFTWAFMLRADMINIGFDSINKYAVGESENNKYSNNVAMFSEIVNARTHGEIANITIRVLRQPNEAESEKWNDLYKELKKLNGYPED